MTTSYRLKRDSKISQAKAGDIVYALKYHDYGLSSDDSRFTGRPHTSVTLNPNGDYPSFTVPDDDLEVIKSE